MSFPWLRRGEIRAKQIPIIPKGYKGPLCAYGVTQFGKPYVRPFHANEKVLHRYHDPHDLAVKQENDL